jgi:hypothetical protein
MSDLYDQGKKLQSEGRSDDANRCLSEIEYFEPGILRELQQCHDTIDSPRLEEMIPRFSRTANQILGQRKASRFYREAIFLNDLDSDTERDLSASYNDLLVARMHGRPEQGFGHCSSCGGPLDDDGFCKSRTCNHI